MAQIDELKELKWLVGRPAELWLSQRVLVAKMIKEFDLKPLPVEDYPYLPMGVEKAAEAAAMPMASEKASLRIRWPFPFPGGIRIPHFHFEGDVYLVESKQWEQFSTSVVKDVQQRLANASRVSFEQVLAIEEAAVTAGV